MPRDEWNALVGDESPFLEWEWLASLEEAGCVGADAGWLPRPLVLREDGRLVAACPLYVKAHSEGEFVFDWGWADAAAARRHRLLPEAAGRRARSRRSTGARFLRAPGADRAALRSRARRAALRELCDASTSSPACT